VAPPRCQGYHRVVIELADASAPPLLDVARDLFREYQVAIGVDLCFQGFERELASLPGAYAPPAGRLMVALVDGAPAGCGALRPLAAGVAELKRMWVRPTFRGKGLGRSIAEALLQAADGQGYRAARLDTLESMKEARALYASLGFREIPPYYENPLPGVIYMERTFAHARGRESGAQS
jgi:putative acetyltransferase